MMRLLPALAALLMVAVPAATLAPTVQPLAGPDEVPNEVLVSFDGPIPADAEAWVRGNGGQLLSRNDAIHFVAVRLPDAAAADRFLGTAAARADVRLAERDGYVYADFTPNDPLYGSQYAPQQANLPDAWDVTRGSSAVKVAILDTGVKLDHADLVGNLCGPFRAFDGSGSVSDVHGHGTHTSGIAAAGLDNGIGIAGAGNSCLMHGKVLSNSGGGQWSWLADGITWAADNGAHVISMSLGGGGGAGVVQQAAKYALTKNAILFASSGNGGCDLPNQRLGYPAEYDEVVGVGAQDPGGLVAGYSTCGLDLEITAGGTAVLSTWRTGGYAALSGTSMSAPLVAGSAALVVAAVPGIRTHDLRCLLDLTADEVLGTSPGRDWESGWGAVDPTGAIQTHGLLVAQGLWDEFQSACAQGARAIMY